MPFLNGLKMHNLTRGRTYRLCRYTRLPIFYLKTYQNICDKLWLLCSFCFIYFYISHKWSWSYGSWTYNHLYGISAYQH